MHNYIYDNDIKFISHENRSIQEEQEACYICPNREQVIIQEYLMHEI